jgi:hypothetical protein
MSKVSIQGDASGTGTLTIAAPNTNSNYTLTLPTNTGTVMTSASDTFSGGLTLGGDLTLDSNGIYLGGTGSANYLDDYEEGTWTPSAGSGITINAIQNATYTKVGRLVTVNAWLKVNPTSSDTTINGLPFTISGRTAASISDVTRSETWSNQVVITTIYVYGVSTAGTNDDLLISVTYPI